MEKVEMLNKALMKARLDKNDIAKAVFSTLKGEFENACKTGSEANSETVEKLAKKMVKNAETINSPESLIEIDLLKDFLPAELSEADIALKVKEVLSNNEAVVSDYKSGNTGKFGFLMGTLIKTNKGIDAKVANKILLEELSK